jgi:hypothetical protein
MVSHTPVKQQKTMGSSRPELEAIEPWFSKKSEWRVPDA